MEFCFILNDHDIISVPIGFHMIPGSSLFLLLLGSTMELRK